MHVLDWVRSPEDFLSSVRNMVMPIGFTVTDNAVWQRKGRHDHHETVLVGGGQRFLSRVEEELLVTWWLVHRKGAKLPTWDLVVSALRFTRQEGFDFGWAPRPMRRNSALPASYPPVAYFRGTGAIGREPRAHLSSHSGSKDGPATGRPDNSDMSGQELSVCKPNCLCLEAGVHGNSCSPDLSWLYW